MQRSFELAALERQLQQVCAGAGRVIVVHGPAGVGKSSLVRAVAQSASGTGVRVLSAWAGPLEREAGWGVVRQLFGPIAAGPEWAHFGVGAAALAQRVLDPDPFAPTPTGDAAHAASYGLSWLAYGLAEDAPTLLVVDDVHWTDAPSLRWLAQLSGHLADLRLGVLCAVRSGESATEPATLADLMAAAPEPPLQPRPLGPDAVETLVTERLPGADPAFVACLPCRQRRQPVPARRPRRPGDRRRGRAVRPRSPRGSPRSARSRWAGAWRSSSRDCPQAPPIWPVPSRSSVAERCCARPRRSPVSTSWMLITWPTGWWPAAWSDEPTTGIALTHPLVANALYLGLPDGERSLLHRRAARVLAAERVDVETVGLHLLHAEPAGEPHTVSTLRAAAERANRRGAPESAAVFLRRALLEPPDSRAHTADLHSELGLCLSAQVRPGAAALLADAVELAATPEQRVRIALSGSRALGMAGHFDRAIELCRLGLSQPVDAGAQLRGSLELEMACGMLLAADTVAEGLDLARRHGVLDDDVLWRVIAAWGLLNDSCPASEVNQLLLPALEAVTPPRNAESLVSTTAKFLLIANGELDTARRLCDGLVEVARPQGWLIALAHGSFMRAIALIHLGRIHEARADAQVSFDFKQANSPPAALVWSLFPLVEALTEMNELDAAEAALDAGHRLGDPPPACVSSTMLLERRAHLRLAQRRYDEAHADLLLAADWWRRLRVRHPGVASWRVDDCEALVALGDSGSARNLALEHLELAERTGLPEPRGAALRALAHTAEPADAVELLEQAVDLLHPSPARLEHTRALVDLGSVLRRTNRRAAARDPLRRGLDLAERGGMLRLAHRARYELGACGARPRRSAVTGIESLTPTERQVADLTAAGDSNREIAQRLYVTRRTVETHLTHVFAKLGISGRSELVDLFTHAAPTVHQP